MAHIIGIAAFAIIVVVFPMFCIWRAITDKTPIIYPEDSTEPTHICGNCRTPIRPVERAEGSGVIEVLLWLFLLVPGIIYSIWRSSTRKPRCPICAAPHPIPMGTPAAEALIAR